MKKKQDNKSKTSFYLKLRKQVVTSKQNYVKLNQSTAYGHNCKGAPAANYTTNAKILLQYLQLRNTKFDEQPTYKRDNRQLQTQYQYSTLGKSNKDAVTNSDDVQINKRNNYKLR